MREKFVSPCTSPFVLVAPKTTQSDFGNETRLIAACQAKLFSGDIDPTIHHRWVYSTMNTTIESYWRLHRARSAQFWIDYFGELKRDGLYNGSIVDKWCLWMVYIPIIQRDVDKAREYHNAHVIRRQRNRVRPNGRPELMFSMPEEYGGRQLGTTVDGQTVRDLMDSLDIMSLELPDYLPAAARRRMDHWISCNKVSITMENAVTIYVQLRNMFERCLEMVP